MKVKETSYLGVQDSVSTSEQRLATSTILANSVSQHGKKSGMASLKTSKIGIGSSQERTVRVFTSSSCTETATTTFVKSTLANVESISLFALPFTSSYTKSSLIVKEGASSANTIISTEHIRTLAAFSNSTDSSWNYTENYVEEKATGIFTAPFHKSDASLSGNTMYLSTIVSLLHSTHSSNHSSTQTSTVKESSATGYLTRKFFTSNTPLIAYAPALGTRQLSS